MSGVAVTEAELTVEKPVLFSTLRLVLVPVNCRLEPFSAALSCDTIDAGGTGEIDSEHLVVRIDRRRVRQRQHRGIVDPDDGDCLRWVLVAVSV